MAKKKKVLIIEDDNILQKAMKAAFDDAGFDVKQAFDGEQGLEAARSEKPDLIFLDLIMPRKDGYHLLSELHAQFPKIPVIISTIINSETSIAECVASGAKGYFIKSDYTLEELVQTAHKFIQA